MTAFRDAVLVRLTRAYDQHNTSLSLLNWLETIQANMALFESNALKARLSANAFEHPLSRSTNPRCRSACKRYSARFHE